MEFINYFFDHGKTPREGQIQAMALLQAHWKDYKYFFVDAPVGVGKTYIALAIAEKLKQSYILTSTKMLQEQYERDSAKVVNLQGRSNYTCTVDTAFTTDAAPCMGDRGLVRKCRDAGTCPYFKQKDMAVAAQMMITNYMYLFNAAQADDDDNPWGKRSSVIMDEAHELPHHLVNYAETDLNLNVLLSKFEIGSNEWEITEDSDSNHQLLLVVKEQIELRIADLLERAENLFNNSNGISSNLRDSTVNKIGRKMAEKVKSLNGQISELRSIWTRLDIWSNTRGDASWLETPDVAENAIKLSPLSASHLFDSTMQHLGEKFVFMSATIGPPEVFARELGLDMSKVCIIKVDSEFEADKSPIVYKPSGRLSYAHIDNSMPKIVDAVNEIMEKHKGEKGIIHTGNYRIAGNIVDGVKTKFNKRMLSRDMYGDDFKSRQSNGRLLDKHYQSSADTVLVSPSMTTGVDLKGDLSRFQIIVKLPYLSLADPRIKAKSDMDSEWYRTQMWLSLLQSTGRSTRSEDDYAVTYILDSGFEYVFNQDAHQLPVWFIDRIRSGSS